MVWVAVEVAALDAKIYIYISIVALLIIPAHTSSTLMIISNAKKAELGINQLHFP